MSDAPTVLIVDDHGDARELLADLLTSVGHRVQQAGDGESALRLLRSGPLPKLVVLDLNMPGRGGSWLLSEMGKDLALCALPFVVVTGEYPIRAPAGALGALSKPVDVDKLLSLVGQICGPKSHAA